METKEFKFNEQTVKFEIENKNVMVNATEMGNIFGKKCNEFTELKNTQELVKKLVEKENLKLENKKKDNSQSGNFRFGNSENPIKKFIFEEEFTPKGKFVRVENDENTWMDLRIGIAFSIWLDTELYLWLLTVIDEIMFGSYKEDEESLLKIAGIQDSIAGKEQELKNMPIIKEIENLQKEEQKEKRKFELRKKRRISGYRTIFTEKEMEGKKKNEIIQRDN